MASKFYILLLFTACLMEPNRAHATAQRIQFEGVRQLGMGNAGIALADDSNMLWYNPAGLARVRGNHFDLIDLTVGYDSNDTLNRMKNALFNNDTADLIRLDTEFMQLTNSLKFLTKYVGASLFNNFSSFTDLWDLQSINATVDIWTFDDFGAIGGIGIPFSDYFSFGGSLRVFSRMAVDSHLTALDFLNSSGASSASNFQQAALNKLKTAAGVGYAVGLNAGALVRVPMPEGYPKIMFGVTYNDMGMTSFHHLSPKIAVPAPIPPSLNFGTAWTYTLGPKSKFIWAIDLLRNDEKKYTLPIHERINAGMEWKYRALSLRGGVTNGYGAWGFGFEFPPQTRIQFTQYNVDLGQFRYEDSQKCYEFQLIIGFNPL